MDDRGSIPGWVNIFPFSTAFIPSLRPTQTHTQYRVLISLGVKRPGRESEKSHSSNVEVKND
jgi:hypothetical protein